MAEISELATCPFCGADNAMMLGPTCRPETPYNPADRLFPIVRCGSCCAEVSGDNEDYRGKSAIAAWNRRAEARQAPEDGVQRGLEDMQKREAEILHDYEIGNLTGLGVANYLLRAGFNSRYCTEKANSPATPEPQPAGAVTKGLEWDDDLDEDEWTAFPLYGQFHIRLHEGRWELRLSYASGADIFQTLLGTFNNLYEAKAAADAENARRIRADLVSAPQPSVVEALRSAKMALNSVVSLDEEDEIEGSDLSASCQEVVAEIDAALASLSKGEGK